MMVLPAIGKVKPVERLGFASSPRVMRRLNARRVLEYAWAATAFTASDVMETTALTRSTVIDVCDELVASGWLDELGDARMVGDYLKGRPARRYELRAGAAAVIGVEAGHRQMSAAVADLRGQVLGRADIGVSVGTAQGIRLAADAETRRALARRVVDQALASAGLAPDSVRAVTVGVPAPVDTDGASPVDDIGFWRLMNPGLRRLFAATAPVVTVENDANLAALAERSAPTGLGRKADSFIALLVGEGIGAGLWMDGRLVRGRRGGAGEMRFLDHVSGVGSSDGLALCARQWAIDAIATGALPNLSLLARLDPDTLTEADVACAAEAGDPAAAAILERLAARLAQICLVLGELLDVDRIIAGGSVVTTMPWVIQRAGRIVADSGDPAAPSLRASLLGSAAVERGAIEHARVLVRESVFELSPRPRG